LSIAFRIPKSSLGEHLREHVKREAAPKPPPADLVACQTIAHLRKVAEEFDLSLEDLARHLVGAAVTGSGQRVTLR
jgi:hypothetical protein